MIYRILYRETNNTLTLIQSEYIKSDSKYIYLESGIYLRSRILSESIVHEPVQDEEE